MFYGKNFPDKTNHGICEGLETPSTEHHWENRIKEKVC